ncbi:hypothetical protein BGZ97_002729 [Linnemannia gamsii]|uniref:C2H2-type domain-containing protein n=1 Tax=Linnemannia gamsii TaxID=64522 RepID=A0A9P6UI67_9FUNG|nr:hypothetical protein BGZ97_002729 [Linnemannia gamsii]
MDMDEDIGGQEEQEDDGEDGDDDEDGSLSEADSGSASAGDPGPSRRKKDRKGICAPGGPSASDGPPRRIRIQENKSHQCNQCEKRFSRPSQLLTHSFTHSGEKPHQCPHCKRLFNVASNLKRHIRIHSNSKRRSSRNGNVVFRSFAQGTHVTQMVTGTIGSIGANRSGGGGNRVSGSTPVPNDPRRAVAPSPRTPAFDKLRWMNTETPTKGLTAAQQQQQQVHMANYRPIKAKLAAAAAIASSASTSSPSSSSTSATASITPSTTTTRATSLSTPATPMTPSTAVATPATPSSGARSFGSSSGRDSTSTSDTTLTNSSSVPPSSTSTDDGDLPDKPRQQPEGTRVLPPPLILSILSPLPPPAPLP